MAPGRSIGWGGAAAALLLLAAGCATVYDRDAQARVTQTYYSGSLAEAARLAMALSDQMADSTGENALLCHLEAGSVNLDAGEYDNSLVALLRAEQLMYGGPGEGAGRYQFPGDGGSFRGYRSDWLTLNLLLFFNYFQRGDFEDALVEIRRMRQAQFEYLLQDSDQEVRSFDRQAAVSAAAAVMPYRMSQAMKKSLLSETLIAAGLNSKLTEYRQRRRPALPVFYNPLAFYLSAVGYYWDNEFEEAVIDLNYLWQMLPDNPLYRRDYATLLKMLKDPVPEALQKEAAWNHPLEDQMVLVILARGAAGGWENQRCELYLPEMVPASWTVCRPAAAQAAPAAAMTVRAAGNAFRASSLADAEAVRLDEYWQLTLPRLLESAVDDIRLTTQAHNAAQATIDSMDKSDDAFAVVALLAARAALEATSRADVDHSEWRSWSTLPSSWLVAHAPIGAARTVDVEISDASGRRLFQQRLNIEPDVNRAIVYIREISGKYHCKLWGSME